jgi:hypothetical protein
MKMREVNKKGQFYLIAAIIIAGILIALFYATNYSQKRVSYDAEEISEELRIEAEYVLDYELNNPGTGIEEFEDFAMEYSDYAKDKEIYFILVDLNDGIQEHYKYTGATKVPSGELYVGGNEIQFKIDGGTYIFPLEEGKNFYSVILYDKGGERYVYTI